jgi:hypothetical protein
MTKAKCQGCFETLERESRWAKFRKKEWPTLTHDKSCLIKTKTLQYLLTGGTLQGLPWPHRGRYVGLS